LKRESALFTVNKNYAAILTQNIHCVRIRP